MWLSGWLGEIEPTFNKSKIGGKKCSDVLTLLIPPISGVTMYIMHNFRI